MSLNIEWRDRLNTWLRELPRHVYVELEELALEGFVTTEQLSPDQAAEGDFAPMPPGTRWGGKWQYGWFRTRVVLPEAVAGRRIALRVDPGGESLVWVNGRLAGARDGKHQEITLSRDAEAGAAYDVLVETYAGHGPTPAASGPVPPGRDSIPEPPETQREVGRSSVGIWQEEAYQLWVDVETLVQLRDELDPDSLRVQEIDAGLKDFTLLVDFELPREQALATMEAARKRLKPLLSCVNGSTSPKMYAFGHAHLDVAWLWPLAETERKSARTFANQLALAEEYPEYRFQQSQPHLYRMVQQLYPELDERVRQAVADGNIIAEGGMWVEADTNISSGESLIRQFIHGLRYYREELGVECTTLWLPDVFGYSGALPQIMRGCGIKYFSTQKIYWTYHGGDPFPYTVFTWEGIDGSEVVCGLHRDYNSRLGPRDVIRRWRDRANKEGYSIHLFPFGWGDGGGGPERTHIEFARRMKDLEGAPQVVFSGPAEYFADLEAAGVPDARYVGELYFQNHRGTYTSQAKTKKGNRRSEFALREAELWGCVARSLGDFAFTSAQLDEAWKKVLLNQFHDIIPGSSIARVYQEAETAYDEVITEAGEVADAAAASLLDDSRAVTAFNSLSWDRTALVELPEDFPGAIDAEGDSLCVQELEGRKYVETTIPSCGWTPLKRADAPRSECDASASSGPCGVEASERVLANERLHLELDDRGRLVRIYDKEADRELAAGPCNEMRMYKDVPTNFDAWDIDSMYRLQRIELDEPAEVEVLAAGPLFGALRIERKLHNSTMVQVILLRRGSRRVDFRTRIEWQEDHKMLKVAFPVTYHASEAVHEIQFGHIRRPNHDSRPYDADRYEVSHHKWSALVEEGRGFAVLNDCKYGLDVVDKTIQLTLLRAPKAPDMHADKGTQEFTYSLYAWNGGLVDSRVVQEAYELNVPVVTVAGAAEAASAFGTDTENVVIETVKPAEDGSRDVVVRLYEACRTATACTLRTSLPVRSAVETNMLEEPQGELPVRGGAIELDFRPFEVKTVRLRRD